MILMFGKTGQVATELQSHKDVIALGRHQADLSVPITCTEAIQRYKPRAVINAAAYTAVDKAESEENLATMINGEAPGAMASVCAELDIPFVHISTDYVFDGSGTKPWSVTDTPNPQNAYARSKLKGEQAIKASGCVHAILRTSWVVSAHGNNFVKTMRRLSETRDRITVVDDQMGGPTCARDIAQTCLSIAEQLIQDSSKSGIYHYSGQPNVSWCQFANAIFEQMDCKTIASPIPTTEYPTPALRPLNSRLDCEAIEDTYGIARPFWRDGLEEILRDLEGEDD
ncbi:dTDP-4-dehydrorhamnose reductase [Rhodobacterales bacterium FZCC0083]|nr:dTDP-4-dehydrorhamnose reductase [Rhodobacterales bacterium FZCC0083]